MTAKDLEDTLAAIASKAKAMREAGVVGTVTIGDVSFVLDGPEQQAPVMTAPQAPELAAIDDPITYGMTEMPTRRQRGTRLPDESRDE